MKIEEAIVYLLVERNGGMTAEQIATDINTRRLHIRKDGQMVSTKQIWWVVNHFKSMFAFTQGRIYLLI